MTEYAGLLEQSEQNIRSAHTELEQALGQLGAGMERGESYIGLAMS